MEKQLRDLIKKAMIEKDKLAQLTYKSILENAQKLAKEKKEDVNDSYIISAAKKEIKQLEDLLKYCDEGSDKYNETKAKINLAEGILPRMTSKEDIMNYLVSENVEKNMGACMKVLKSRFKDVANVFRHPGSLLIIMLLVHVVIPTAACGAGHLFFGNNMELITGMVLEFAVPTAVVSLMWVTIYDGNSPLSLSLVVLDTVLAPFLIPATLKILLGSAVTIDPARMMRELIFMVALPAVVAMVLNQITDGKVMETWPGKLAPFSKLALIFVVTSNSSKVAPYIRDMNMQRVKVALAILVLAASGYALGWFVAYIFRKDRRTAVSMMYGTGMRNISAGAVIAAAYFPGEVMFPVMIGTLFQQVLAALFEKLLAQKKEKQEFC